MLFSVLATICSAHVYAELLEYVLLTSAVIVLKTQRNTRCIFSAHRFISTRTTECMEVVAPEKRLYMRAVVSSHSARFPGWNWCGSLGCFGLFLPNNHPAPLKCMSTHWFALLKQLMFVIVGFQYLITTYTLQSGPLNKKRVLYYTKIWDIALFLCHFGLIAVELFIDQSGISMQS